LESQAKEKEFLKDPLSKQVLRALLVHRVNLDLVEVRAEREFLDHLAQRVYKARKAILGFPGHQVQPE
jgi:hypothetical protein